MTRQKRKRIIKTNCVWYSFIIVSIVTLLIFTYIPMFTSLKYSFYDVSVLGFGETYVGTKNYNVLISNKEFQNAVKNTFGLALLSLIVIPLGFILASLINGLGRTKAQSFFRVGFYLPNVLTGVSVILIFQVILKSNGGLLNSALSSITGREVTIGWFIDSKYSWGGATILNVWQNLGYSMLMNLASLQSISTEIYEAADIDGAGFFKKWIYITIPHMTSCFAFLFITNIISGLSRFTDLYILGGNSAAGRPGGSLQTILMYIYQFSFEQPQYGIASAGAMILFVITFVVTMVNLFMTGFFKSSKKE